METSYHSRDWHGYADSRTLTCSALQRVLPLPSFGHPWLSLLHCHDLHMGCCLKLQLL